MKLRWYAATVCLLAAPHAASATPKYTTLYQFKNGHSGANPQSGLIAGPNGVLYGTTSSSGDNNLEAGTVFALTPPAQRGAKWTLTTLWIFHGGEGASPIGTLLMDQAGALYGTTYTGNKDRQAWGTIFKLSPPADGATRWSFAKLWTLRVDREGANPAAGLVMDDTGALYGTTTLAGEGHGSGWGTVFKLSPPSQQGGTWSYQRLSFFPQNENPGGVPAGPLYRDAGGVLYGTTSFGGRHIGGFGDAFTLSPPQQGGTKWTRTLIAHFGKSDATPEGGLLPGAGGTFYGSTSGLQAGTAGTVYELTPPAQGETKWRTKTLFRFNGSNGATPTGELTADGNGGLYGADFNGGPGGYGTLFHLVPPANGGKQWSLTTLHAFQLVAEKPSALQPNGGLVIDAHGSLYGTAFQDSKYFAGAVFELDP